MLVTSNVCTPTRLAGSLTVAFALLLFLVLRASPSMAEEAPSTAQSFSDAQALIRDGRGSDAVTLLHDLAGDGDTRAQILLGSAYSEGEWLPRDSLQAYVWLRTAAKNYRGKIHQAIMWPKASEMVLHASSGLSGADLIKGDALVATFIEARNRAWDESFARGVRGQLDLANYLDTRFLFHAGCAADPARKGCSGSIRDSKLPRCSGLIEANPDAKVTADGKGTKIFMPPYPGYDGQVGVQAHVDRSGWVCYVKVVDSSDNTQIDRAVIETVSRWRFLPATKAGEPVETLHTTYVTIGSKR